MRKMLLLGPALMAFASAAAAEGHSWRIGADRFNVHVSDLDLRTAPGRAQALERIEAAAGKLCRSANLRSDRDDCRAAVLADALRGPLGPTLRSAQSERGQTAWAMNVPK